MFLKGQYLSTNNWDNVNCTMADSVRILEVSKLTVVEIALGDCGVEHYVLVMVDLLLG